jgi:predicted unusual protein kinase regulating ubiquinone biosynthesis (AarF/ABC1/UbiB family)/DNA-binding XRE family transcriptional regulator
MSKRGRATTEEEAAGRLVRLRQALGFSQREMASELGVAHGAVGQWETGQRPLPGPVLKLLAIYEAELGLADDRDGDGGGDPEKDEAATFDRLATSWSSRHFKLSRAAGATLGRAVVAALSGAFIDENAPPLSRRVQTAVARQVVTTLGQMKGLPMKLGQMASYLDFGLAPATRALLASLTRQSPPMSPARVAEVFVEELGHGPGKIFAEWSPRPLAAASIGQVHRARLTSGQEVAVKVQYPRIVEALEADLKSAALIHRAVALVYRGFEPGPAIEELRARFLEECDYRAEADSQEEFRRLWAHRPEVRIPRVFTELCTQRILVSELAAGDSFEAFSARASQEERNRAGGLLWDVALETLFRHGVFNVDPHPGNYLFGDGVVTFLDFGCVKRIDRAYLGHWKALARAILERDVAAADRLGVQLRAIPDPRGFDFDHQHRVNVQLYEPYLGAGPYRFTPAFLSGSWNAAFRRNSNRARINLPPEWLFLPRLQWGLYAILARLEASVDFRGKLLDLLYAPGEPRPAPYTPEELARVLRVAGAGASS